MSRFNSDSVGSKTLNIAGGEAYKVNPKFELASILLTSFVKDQFYKKATDVMDDMKKMVGIDPLFAAKAAIYARREYGMRSITHVVAGEVAKQVKGAPWTKNFFSYLFKRPDDMMETVGYYKAKYGIHPLPNALKKGIRAKLSTLNEYTLGKYRGEGKDVKMVDLVNLTHPKNTPAIEKLVKGTLRSKDTWEVELTKAGQKGETKEEVLDLKKDAWTNLLSEKKLGYFALLRNLRNIIQQAPDALPLALEQLVNPEAIQKSLVLPFRFSTAMEEIQKLGGVDGARETIVALNKAMEASFVNVPEFSGKTLIVVDDSGSMQGRPFEIASLFAAALFKKNPGADMMMFSDDARWIMPNPNDSMATIRQFMGQKMKSSGTNFAAIFQGIHTVERFKSYERIIILSDMQGWMDNSTVKLYEQYCVATNYRPHLYSWDLAGHGTIQFPEHKTYLLAGFSEKVFDVMKMLEEDRNALVTRIEQTQFIGE